jgi:uncharacterized tellurite resistance protein B-like protein
MSHLENFDHPIKKQNKEFFVHLVKIAMADGIIWHTELELLQRMGRKLGFTASHTNVFSGISIAEYNKNI